MADTSTKPHTRQKMRLKTMKQVNCVECSTLTRKRHVLLCFHCYCDKCFTGLAKGLMGLQTGLVCTVCKTFDPFVQKEEKDDGPPVFCKIHGNMRYVLNCVPCNQIVCYRCKMSDHYYHQSETIQSALDRIMPFVKQASEEEESQNAMLRRKYMENGGQICLMKEKVDKLENYIKNDRDKIEKKLKLHYKKIKTMKDDPLLKQRRIHDNQREMTKYFMRIKLPFHTPQLCPDEGGIELIRSQYINDAEFDCEIGSCAPIINPEEENCDNCQRKLEEQQQKQQSMDTGMNDNRDPDSKNSNKDNNNQDSECKNSDNDKNGKIDQNDVKSDEYANKNDNNLDNPVNNGSDSKPSSSSTSTSYRGKGGPNITFSTVKLPNKSKPSENSNKTNGSTQPLNAIPAIEKQKQEAGMENKVIRQVHTDRDVTVLQWVDKNDDAESIKRSTNRVADIVVINGDGTVPFAQNELVEALFGSQSNGGGPSKSSTVQITELDPNHDKQGGNDAKLKPKLVNGNNNSETSSQSAKTEFENAKNSDKFHLNDSSSSDKENNDLHLNSKTGISNSKLDSNSEKDVSLKCSHNNDNTENNNYKEKNDCKTLSKITKKSLKHKKHDKNICAFRRDCKNQGYTVKSINEETCVATLEKEGVETTVTLLCEDCENKRKGIDMIDYREVEEALQSEEPIEIGETRIGKELIYIKFTPTNNDATKLFEKVDFDDDGNLLDTETGKIMKENVIGKVEVVKKPYKLDTTRWEDLHRALIEKAYKEKREKGEPFVETCSCYDKVTLKPFKESFRNSNLDLKTLLSKKFKYNGFFCYGSPKKCQRMCWNGDRVYLPCANDSKYFIMQYHPENGKLLKNGRPPSGVDKPTAMYPFNEDQLLLAAGNGLYLLNKHDMTLVCKLLKGSLSDVSLDGNRIAVLENEKSHVHILDLSTNPPTYENIIHVEQTSSVCHTIVLRGDALFVSTQNHKIKKYSLSGELLWQWGSHGDGGPGFLDTPNICSVDKNESLLVVDTANKRLQIVDSACQWQVLKLEGVENPSDAMVTDDGYVYVSDHQRCVVYWYKFDV